MNEDERLKAQERRNRQMARGAVNMPADLVTGSHQVPTATVTPGGGPPRNTTRMAPGGRPTTTSPGAAPGAPNGPSSASERNRQRMAEEERIKAQARQGRVTRPVTLPPDLVVATQQVANPSSGPAPSRPPPQTRTTTSAPRKTTEQRMREEEELKAAARRGRTAQIATALPSDLRQGTTPPGAVQAAPRQTTVVSHQTLKDQERQAREMVRGTFAPPSSSRTTSAPVRMPSDMNVQHSTPSGEMSRPTTTTIVSHSAVKNQEREARDLVRGTFSPTSPSRQVSKPVRIPSDMKVGGPLSGPAAPSGSAQSGKDRERQAREMVRLTTTTVPGANVPPAHTRATTAPISTEQAAAIPTPPPKRTVSDHQQAKDRLAEEERIKQRERQARVTTVANVGAHVAPAVGPDVVPVTMSEPVARAASAPAASPVTAKSGRTLGGHSRRAIDQSEADAKAKDRARRPRGAAAPPPPGISPKPSMSMKKGDGTMQDVMANAAANTAGPPVIEEEAMQVPVGAVSVFTNGVVVAQQRGELTQLAQPPIQEYQIYAEEEEERPVADASLEKRAIEDDEDEKGVMEQHPDVESMAEDAESEQTVNAFVPDRQAAAIEAMKKIDEEDEVPWYKSSEFRCCFCCVLLAAIIGAVVGVVLSGGDDGGGGGVSPTPAPVPKNTDSPTESPTVTPLDPGRVIKARGEIVAGGVTSAEVLEDQETPQYRAYIWLLREDEFSWSGIVDGSNVMLNRYLLATFYYSLKGNAWLSNDGWLDPFVGHCLWQHVQCDSDGDVTGINTGGRPGVVPFLGQNNMEGSLPSEIVHFAKLAQLRLQGNRIFNIDALGQGMPSLTTLDLGGSPLEGFSALAGLPNLDTISIRETTEGGPIPQEFFMLSKLLAGDISANSFTGTLSTELGFFSDLRDLTVAENSIEGDISVILGSVRNKAGFRSLNFLKNSLTGSLPSVIGDFGSFENLSVESNQLSGTLPTELGALRKLSTLNLRSNLNMEGSLPSEMGEMNMLANLRLEGLFLDGTIPTEFGNLQRLEWFDIAQTFIQGTLPTEFGNLQNLKRVHLDSSSLTGAVDASLCSIPGLSTITHSAGLTCPCPSCMQI